ncbi:MAG: TrbC/VirB2 family protein [Rubrivivax sp.]
MKKTSSHFLAAPLAALAGGPAWAAADPQGSGPLLAALAWVQGTLLGNVATAVAVIAVAMVGFMMLTGRLNWRFGATVVLGCFILFGSAAIVTGIRGAAVAAGQ